MKRIVILLFLCLSSAKKSFCVDWKRELRLSFISDKSVELRVVEAGNNYFRDNNFLCIQYNLEMPIDKLGCKELESAEKINALCYRSKMDIFSDFELKDDGFLYGKIANEPFSYNPVREVPLIFGNEFSFAIPGMTSWLKIGTKEYEEGLYNNDTYKKKEKTKHKYNDFYNYAIKSVNSSSHLIETQYGIEFDYSGLNLDSFLYEIKGYWG